MQQEVVVWPVHASLVERLRIASRALKVLEFEPDHPVQGPLFEWCMDRAQHRTAAAQLRGTEQGRRILSERPSLQGGELDLGALAKLPAGTLGAEFARYFETNGIQPFVSTFAIDSDEVYLAKRYRETHDLLHVVTGYATHMLGEMELQAFVLGNLKFPSAAMIVLYSFVLRFRICGFREGGAYVKRLWAAYRRGQQSQMLLGVPFEQFWERPVAEVTAAWCAPAQPVPVITLGVHQAHKEAALKAA